MKELSQTQHKRFLVASLRRNDNVMPILPSLAEGPGVGLLHLVIPNEREESQLSAQKDFSSLRSVEMTILSFSPLPCGGAGGGSSAEGPGVGPFLLVRRNPINPNGTPLEWEW